MKRHANDAAFVLGILVIIGGLAWIEPRLLLVIAGGALSWLAFIRNSRRTP